MFWVLHKEGVKYTLKQSLFIVAVQIDSNCRLINLRISHDLQSWRQEVQRKWFAIDWEWFPTWASRPPTGLKINLKGLKLIRHLEGGGTYFCCIFFETLDSFTCPGLNYLLKSAKKPETLFSWSAHKSQTWNWRKGVTIRHCLTLKAPLRAELCFAYCCYTCFTFTLENDTEFDTRRLFYHSSPEGGKFFCAHLKAEFETSGMWKPETSGAQTLSGLYSEGRDNLSSCYIADIIFWIFGFSMREKIDFKELIRHIIRQNIFTCHGEDL